MLDLTADENGVVLAVKIVPGASRTRYLGQWENRAKFAVAAPPDKGRANKALTAFLAEMFAVRRRDVIIVAGHTSPMKTIRIEGVTVGVVRAALQPPRP